MTVTPFPTAHVRAAAHRAPYRAIGLWLLVCAGMIFAMAVIGAITRLTESGLSITEWKPVTGALPPLSDAAWAEEFAKYQATPEYALKHSGMDLAQFKGIFFWEWFHRLVGRLIGVVFLLPFLFFLFTRRVPRSLVPRLIGLFVLGGLQGALGWYMVKSGLVNRPDVSHYRLAAHLSLAVLIYVAMLATALPLLFPAASGAAHPARGALRRHAGLAMALVATTMVWGAFTAGLDAGMAYNTWPLMNGTFAPEEMWNLSPAWLNILENTAAVQFTHRWLAILTGLVVWSYAFRALRAGVQGRVRTLAIAVAVMVLVQISLGITTLLLFVPVHVAATHQAGALVLLGLFTWTVMEYRRG
ncbi:COX15/CtaA family protein [Nitrospirillum sp. BR 11752]|uniref:COX15/CtaA family protein n=1 Tax=Nitrospirillum sp. BR 11752 TaxID=3104293 RepID=UPI002EAE0F5C|nr:COX15/CtaA family protein [Nitrospirillum sp. BR 11752]